MRILWSRIFPRRRNDLGRNDLAQIFRQKWPQNDLIFKKKRMKWIIYPCVTCFWIKNSTFDFILAGFYFLVFAIIAYLAGIDMMELLILFQTHSIYPITAFQYRFQAENSHKPVFLTFWGQKGSTKSQKVKLIQVTELCRFRKPWTICCILTCETL